MSLFLQLNPTSLKRGSIGAAIVFLYRGQLLPLKATLVILLLPSILPGNHCKATLCFDPDQRLWRPCSNSLQIRNTWTGSLQFLNINRRPFLVSLIFTPLWFGIRKIFEEEPSQECTPQSLWKKITSLAKILQTHSLYFKYQIWPQPHFQSSMSDTSTPSLSATSKPAEQMTSWSNYLGRDLFATERCLYLINVIAPIKTWMIAPIKIWAVYFWSLEEVGGFGIFVPQPGDISSGDITW